MKILTLTLALAGSQAVAQQNCAPHEIAVQGLANNYGESRRAVAMTHDGLFVEIFANDNGGWSLLATGPDGISCMFGYGENFEIVRDALPPLGDEG